MIRFRRRCLYTSMNLQWKFIRPTFLFVKSIPPRSFEWERGRLPNMSAWMRGYLDSTQNYLINFPLIIRWTLYNCLNHICPKHSHLWCEAKDITTISKNYSHIHCRGLSWAIFHFYLPIEELECSIISLSWCRCSQAPRPTVDRGTWPMQCRWCVQLWTLMVISRASYLSCTALPNWYALCTIHCIHYTLCIAMHYALSTMHYALWTKHYAIVLSS